MDLFAKHETRTFQPFGLDDAMHTPWRLAVGAVACCCGILQATKAMRAIKTINKAALKSF